MCSAFSAAAVVVTKIYLTSNLCDSSDIVTVLTVVTVGTVVIVVTVVTVMKKMFSQKNSNCDETQKPNCDKTQELKL